MLLAAAPMGDVTEIVTALPPMEAVLPLGSLVYEGQQAGEIGAAGEQDTFMLSIDPGQTLTVVLSADESLQAAVQITPGSDANVVQQTASGAGEAVILQSMPTQGKLIGNGPAAAIYEITVSGVADSTGNYTLQTILNAAVEIEDLAGAANDGPSTAQNLASAFQPLAQAIDDSGEDSRAERAAVLGRLSSDGATTVPSNLGSVEGGSGIDVPFNIGAMNQPSIRYQQIYAASEFSEGGPIGELRFRRDRSAAAFQESGIDIQINLSYAATSVSTLSSRFANNIGAGQVTVFDGLLDIESNGSGYPNPFDIVIDVEDVFEYDPSRGDLLVEMRIRNSPHASKLDSSPYYQQETTNRVYAFDADATSGSVSPWYPYGLVTQFGFVGKEDWYSFTREAGEAVTVALTELSAGQATLELYHADGTRLARGVSDLLKTSETVANFAPEDEAGIYYVRVSGEGNTQYSLLVTRNAELDRDGNDTIPEAQELLASEAGGRRWALGAVDEHSDFYAITVDGQKTLTLETHTPGGGLGEMTNDLDPMLRLYDGNGQLVALDDNASTDGRNAEIRYRVPRGAGGVYYVEVLSSEAAADRTTGEYIFSVKQADSIPSPFEATLIAPPEGFRTRRAPTRATVEFNDAVLLPTVEPADVTVSGAPATGVFVVDGNTLSFDLPTHAVQWASSAGGSDHYYMLTELPASWLKAEQQAQALGGHLVSIDTERERQFLQHHFLSGEQRGNSYWTQQGGVLGDAGHTPAGRRGIIELTALPTQVWPLSDGVHSLTIAAGSVNDVQSMPVSEASTSVLIDLTPPHVTSVSPLPNAVNAPGNLEVRMTFSEPIDVDAFDPSGLSLRGQFREGSFAHETLYWNEAGTALTLSYSSLPDDRYTLTVPSGDHGIRDLVGWHLDGEGRVVPSGNGFEGGNFQPEFAVDPSGGANFPRPLNAMAPAGSLIHDSAFVATPGATATAGAEGTIAYAGDQDTFTIDLDPHQSLTVVVETGDELQPTIEILDPWGTVVGEAVATAARGAAVGVAPATAGGVYTIRIGGAAGSMGLYSVRMVLNADVERELHGVDNNSINTAQNLEPSFTPLLKGADRGAVLGRADGTGAGLGPDGFGYMATSVPFAFEDISTTGTRIPEFYRAYPWATSRLDGYMPLTDADLGDFQFDFYGKTYKDLYVSIDGILTFRSGLSSPNNSDLRYSPSPPIIAALWDDFQLLNGNGEIYWEVRGEGDNQELIVQWDEVWIFPLTVYQSLTFQIVLREADNSIQFNYLDLHIGNAPASEGGTATVGIKDAWSQPAVDARRLTVSYNDASNPYVGSGQSLRFHHPNPTADYYAVDLEAGEKVTVAANALDLGVVDVELVDDSSNLLASGHNISVSEDVISNFEAPATGTYYIRVNGDLDVDYSLVVTRNAAFDTEGNSTPRIAQDFAGQEVALGHVGGPASTPGNVRVAVHANDWDWTSRQGALRVANQLNDSSVYDFTATVVANEEMDTVAELENYDVVIIGSWYYREFPMDVAQALRSWVQSGSGGLVAIGNANRQLTQFTTNQWVRITMDPIIPLDLGDDKVPYAYAPVTVIDSRHPVTHGITEITGNYQGESSFSKADPDALILGIEGSWAKRPGITVSEASGGRTVHLMPQYGWPDYGDLRVPGSSGDRLLEQAVAWANPPGLDEADVYSFTAEAGATLDLFTATPGDGPGEFANTLDPRLTLYDADGKVVATGVPTADGRNEQIVYTVPIGAVGPYRIAVTAENGTAGEYVLDPIRITPPEPSIALLQAAPEIRSALQPPSDGAGDPAATENFVDAEFPSGLWEESPQDDYDLLAMSQLETEPFDSQPEPAGEEEGDSADPLVDSLFADDAFLEDVLAS